MQTKGNISIHAQKIMPVIKRWLYSDKDIFIRELVSNGCDAITKLKMVKGDTEEELNAAISRVQNYIKITDTNGSEMYLLRRRE